MIVILIGPMGCGKTTVGKLLAARLGWPFDDADDFHSPANKEKMHSGVPLTDDDRLAWLTLLAGRIAQRLTAGENLVLACSALKRQYRTMLGVDQKEVVTVYLEGDTTLLQQRIAARDHQFMAKELLSSQLATMEPPTEGLTLSIASSPQELAERIINWLKHRENNQMQTPVPPSNIPKIRADIGVAGLAVMGENLVLNMADKGFSVAVYNRTTEKVDGFLAGRAKGKEIIGCHAVKTFVQSIKRPRKIMMMLKAGAPVDQFIEQLLPFLEPGDVLIDGGNSHYHDTIRRMKSLEAKGLFFIGTGVSGGEEGALRGPSIMPGGSKSAWPLLTDIFCAIAAKAEDGSPCCAWMGADGAGHFVKMVHNGIEYGDMQLIGEAYQIMCLVLGLSPTAMQTIFQEWNEGRLKSYLIEITAAILGHKERDGRPTIDLIEDIAGQKGTGKWTVNAALEHGVDLSLIAESVFARCIAAEKDLRLRAAGILTGPNNLVEADSNTILKSLEQALFGAKIISYTQGFSLLQKASASYGWGLDLAAVARIWRGGCIIRSAFLDTIAAAYTQNNNLDNLLLAPEFSEMAREAVDGLRDMVILAVRHGIAAPCMSAALSYYDSLRSPRLPANLLQAQRDYFGAHTYERIDRPRGQFHHTDWTGSGGATTSSAYTR